ncbi:FAD-dependent oxidoreductase [Microbacterium allomyrinae]|uniref:FAD-dependent monooxygenase n=1 Tax=Microbacterium allomyrinae TaxID=2830666 RepID=A0A9X1LWZ2_9MICO|nr:FAD-dependent monooxygenase [Microbacterium allomyrinae]MCC2033173.1 FAD-dependent monooxygenase [Microbacterium allomyrinae]
MSAPAPDVDVLVVGGGPVGMLNALGLARAGVSVRVLEAEPAIVQSPRAMVYHWAALEGLDRLGVLDEAMRRGFTKQESTYRVFRTGEAIDLTLSVLEGQVAHPYNLHLGQHQLAEIALEQLVALGVPVHFGVRVNGVTQSDHGARVSAVTAVGPVEFGSRWVIAADGARSGVRAALGIPFEGFTWEERFVATNIRFDFQAHGFARSTMIVDPRYGAIIAKIDDTGLWRLTYCESRDLPAETVLERMPAFLKAVLPGDGKYELDQFTPYRMHQRAAPTFRAGRVLLAGDAAHATNPSGGLGLTSGLFDTFVLYDALAGVLRGAESEDVLDRYADERRRVFLENASPTASENKRFVYHSHDPERLESDLAALRRVGSDESLQRERAFGIRRLETAPLVRL